jgi:hypothetical protein
MVYCEPKASGNQLLAIRFFYLLRRYRKLKMKKRRNVEFVKQNLNLPSQFPITNELPWQATPS